MNIYLHIKDKYGNRIAGCISLIFSHRWVAEIDILDNKYLRVHGKFIKQAILAKINKHIANIKQYKTNDNACINKIITIDEREKYIKKSAITLKLNFPHPSYKD